MHAMRNDILSAKWSCSYTDIMHTRYQLAAWKSASRPLYRNGYNYTVCMSLIKYLFTIDIPVKERVLVLLR